MSSGGLIVSITILLVGIGWLALPYLRGNQAERNAQREKQRERLTLTAAYEQALMTVRDLDEDFQVGKLSQQAYMAERARWTEHGATLLEAIDKANGGQKQAVKRTKVKSAPTAPAASPIDDPVEQAIAAYARAREQSRDL